MITVSQKLERGVSVRYNHSIEVPLFTFFAKWTRFQIKVIQLRQYYKWTTAVHCKTQTVHNIVFKQSGTLKHSKDKSEWINCWSSLLLESFIQKSMKLEGYILFSLHTYEKKNLSSWKLILLLYWCSVKLSHKINCK